MIQVDYRGKHAELCRALEKHNLTDAMQLIYAFFRSEDNTDSYSVPALTAIRELIEDGESDELSRMRIRMRSNGDKMLLTLTQFLWAFYRGGFEDRAEILSEKLARELEKMARSMQEFADEEGVSAATQMAGKRIREAMRILSGYFEATENDEEKFRCAIQNLAMSRVFLFAQDAVMAADMMAAAQAYADRNMPEESRRLCEEIIEGYENASDPDPAAQALIAASVGYAKAETDAG